ncbi:hypothetical protein ACOKFD_09390 [Flagellimonas sp. S174]|uniref:AbiU2 domain-containing protein n=1 Tax=Flagellimonas sp. S174 TaxID=3410790 RepID=UPI003BF59201
MPSKTEIKENILAIWKISILSKKCLKYSYYLHKPDSPEELDYLNNSRDFEFVRHIMWRNAVIELSKLVSGSSKRDKYNIFHFIKKLKKDQYFGGFGIAEEKIKDWENRLEENRETINIVLSLRDKVYGHTDNKKSKENLDTPTFEKTEKLLQIIDNVIQEIYLTVFDSHADIESSHIYENLSGIIKILAAEKKSRRDGLMDLMKNKK